MINQYKFANPRFKLTDGEDALDDSGWLRRYTVIVADSSQVGERDRSVFSECRWDV